MQAILENPDDDAPRLIYADWLEERGDPRGEFIRIQCQLAAPSANDKRRPQLERHERDLLAQHQDRWLGKLQPLLRGWVFQRGFLDAISVPAAIYLQRKAIPHPATVRRVEVDLDGFDPPLHIVELVPESVARENVVLPIGLRDRTLVMAALEPRDTEMMVKVQFILNRDIEFVAADGDQLIAAIDRLYGATETESVDSILYEFVDSAIEFKTGVEDDDSPVAQLIALIIREAHDVHASQIRIRPRAESVQVLYRLDRQWVERDVLPKRMLSPIVNRIRRLSGLAFISEGAGQAGYVRGVPRDFPLDLAVHIQPTKQGPSVTLIFWPTSNE
ncbi:MAG TPA: TIGR02996 domain-containing protein [Gemmataceae bacterium]